MRPDPNAELRRQLDAGREARRAGVARLKNAAQKAAAGHEMPITDKFDREEVDLSESDSNLPAAVRIQRCRVKAKQSREARSEGVRMFKRTSMAVVQIVRQTVHLDRLDLDDDHSNSNGNGAEPAPQT